MHYKETPKTFGPFIFMIFCLRTSVQRNVSIQNIKAVWTPVLTERVYIPESRVTPELSVKSALLNSNLLKPVNKFSKSTIKTPHYLIDE